MSAVVNERFQRARAEIVDRRESARIAQDQGFNFVDLKIGNEASIADRGRQRLLENVPVHARLGATPSWNSPRAHQGIARPRGLARDTSPKRLRVISGPSVGPAPGPFFAIDCFVRNSLAGAWGSYSSDRADIAARNSLAAALDFDEMPPLRRDGDDAGFANHVTIA